jgi:hypothetical protein
MTEKMKERMRIGEEGKTEKMKERESENRRRGKDKK